jgi:hypothetical protein
MRHSFASFCFAPGWFCERYGAQFFKTIEHSNATFV